MGSPVFANSMEISSKAMGGKSICQFPDVCFTPPQTPATPPGVPIPYPNTGMASDTSDGSTSVKIGGQEVMLKDRSSFKQSTGDEAGAAPKKGLINSKIKGKVYFIAWSMDVKVEGENVVRHLDMTTHNHACNPANGAAPMVHVAAMALAEFSSCKSEAEKVEKECNGDPKVDPCPDILGVPIKSGGADSAVGKIKKSFAARGLSVDAIKAKKPQSRLAVASTTVAEKSKKAGCTRAMRCVLRPYGAEKDGVTGCCPGQTPHHIPPWNTISSVAGNPVSHSNALCICLEGAGHSIGSHGKHHHGINFLMGQAAGPDKALTRSENKKGHILYKGPLKEHVKISAAVTEAQNGCSKECIEEQLNKQFGKTLSKQATHNASTTGGTEAGLLDEPARANAMAALQKAPAIG